MIEIPDDVWGKAKIECDAAGVTRHSDARDICEYVAAFSIIRERKRCAEICEAEREWGGNIMDAQERIEAGDSPRPIPGWNVPYEEDE